VVTVLLLVLLVAAGLRLYRLPDLPLGLHYDEAANGILAGEIASGVRTPVFIRAYTGKEVLFFYWASLWMRLAGRTPLALRLGAASAGILTVAAAVWATYELLHGRRNAVWTAALSGAFVATSFWHVVLSRYGFRAVTQPLLQALTVAALWRGLRLATPSQAGLGRKAGWAWLGLSGLFLGLTAYTYLAARVFPIPLAMGLAALLIVDGGRRRARLAQMAVLVGLAGLSLAPLAYFWLAHPGTFLNRARQVAATTWGEVWAGVRACLAMFVVGGDPYIRFNIPHRPLFSPVVAGLFCVGLVAVIVWCVRWVRQRGKESGGRRPADVRLWAGYIFLVAVIPVMILPSALAVGEVTPSNLRTVGLLPFIYVLPALGLVSVGSLVKRWLPRIVISWLWTVIVLAGLGGATAVAYFRDWAPSPALYYASDGDLVDVADYLNQTERVPGEPAYVASVHYRHPTVAFLARDYGDLVWLTGGRTVVFPQGADSLVVVPHSAAGDLDWVERVLTGANRVASAQAPDGGMAFNAYRVPASLRPEPSRLRSADYAHAVELIGYDVIGEPSSGEQVDLALWWRVRADPEHGDLAPAVQLVDPWGSVWGVASPFHYPGEQWAVGDVIVDHLTIPVRLGAPPGSYDVRVSMYSAQAGSALPVLDSGGRYAGTWVKLPISLVSGASVVGVDADLDRVLGRLGARNRLDTGVGGLRLIGADIDTENVRPGERLRFALFWMTREADLPDYAVEILLGDAAVYSGPPIHGSVPFPDWEAGQVVVDRYDPRLPRELAPGERALSLRLGDPAAGSSHALEIDLGLVNVQAVERTFEVPSTSIPLAVDLAGQVELVGYDVPADTVAPGGTIRLTLYWRAQFEMDQDYTVFVHLVGSDGAIGGQHDGQPVDGTYRTSLWLTGEVVADLHEIAIHPDAPPGEYWIEVGMYVADTGARLVDGVGGSDAARLQPVSIGAP